ncbi:hypothetical protein DHEL01_v211066 [Diaporthe helianthi]|uniref:Uncharacterized protein n=1 Tax=Diaporthe helianthi TaxID=158607 RepID=A0A2P5HJZ4_DIAHE|nr:hypothetical protein DHEL01_v211066 [Diaporthe helianthi]
MHRNFRAAFLVCAAAAGAGLVCAQDVAEGGIALLYGTPEKGPRGESISEFEALLQKPNATGTFGSPGPEVEHATDSNISGDWSWSITIVADLPIPSPPQDSDKFYTGGQLVFHGPFTTTNNSTSSTPNAAVKDDWSVCLYDWSLQDVAYPAALRADNGTCLSMLSRECIAGIERLANSKHTSRGCSCPTASDVPECAELGNVGALWSTTCGAAWYNASDIRGWGADGLQKSTFGDVHPHERRNTTAYNHIGSLAWPVMASIRSFTTGGSVMATMSCPRADTATEGSIAPTDEGLDGGDGQGQDAGDVQSDQQDGGDRVDANWLILGSLLVGTILRA